MEAAEEAIGSNSSSDSVDFINAAAVVKGKRTRRLRHGHLTPAPVASSAANADSSSTSSADRPVEASGSNITDEEDMANCLILLSQGRRSFGAGEAKPGGRILPEEAAAAGGGGKVECHAYECKTCNKSFPSFQALGGHRASHKKPKLVPTAMADDEKVTMKEVCLQISMNSPSMAMPAGNRSGAKPKVHECSICGAEFNSGQALGGHMRRHRPLVAPDQKKIEEEKKERGFLSLDLNLPAPSDDDLQQLPSPDFAFFSKQSLVFSPPPESASKALVDCHY